MPQLIENASTTVRGLSAMLLLAINTIACGSILLPMALVKLALPVPAIRKPIDRLLNAIAELWIRNNSRLIRDADWDVALPANLRRDSWYLVASNHQSWADIIVLQHVLTGRIPLLKFFLKQELIWVPLIGLAWWALDFPFMKRHSKEYLERHPDRRHDDLAAIRRACAKFSLIPTSVMSFIEGTRLSPEKQANGFRHLLPPKAGGLALALNAMGERFQALLDVTIVYPEGTPSFFDLFAGAAGRVIVHVVERDIPPELIGGDYVGDPGYRDRMRAWVGQLWEAKDERIDTILTRS